MKKSKKVIVITGTSSGIGKSLSKYFLKKGLIVEGCSRKNVSGKTKNYFHSNLDISNINDVRDWIKKIIYRQKKIDYLINNAGYAPAAFPALLNSDEIIKETLKTNVLGFINVTNEISKHMIKKKFGRIVSISSMSLNLLQEGTSIYSASKSAEVVYSKILAKELANYNITSNVLGVSMYESGAFRNLGKTIIDNAKQKLLNKRLLSINEITNVLEFFFKKDSSVVSGQEIYLSLVSK